MLVYYIFVFVFAFIYGSILGSFLNVCALRIPDGQSLFNPSQCPECGHRLQWYELIPVLSYLIQKGKCRVCGCRIKPRYFFWELGHGLMWVIAFLIFPQWRITFRWADVLITGFICMAVSVCITCAVVIIKLTRPRIPVSRDNRGMSLMEVIVAMFLTSIISLMAASMINSTVQSYKNTGNIKELSTDTETAESIISRLIDYRIVELDYKTEACDDGTDTIIYINYNRTDVRDDYYLAGILLFVNSTDNQGMYYYNCITNQPPNEWLSLPRPNTDIIEHILDNKNKYLVSPNIKYGTVNVDPSSDSVVTFTLSLEKEKISQYHTVYAFPTNISVNTLP